MSTTLEQQARELADQLFSSQGARIAAIPLIHRVLQRVRDEGAEDTKRIDKLASWWDSQGRGHHLMGRWLPNVTGSFRDALDAHATPEKESS